METVFVTLKIDPSGNGIDIELPVKVPLGNLISGVAESLNLFVDLHKSNSNRNEKIPFVIQVKQGISPFTRIAYNSTVEQAGIFDGAILLIEPGLQPIFSDIKCPPPKENTPCLQDVLSCRPFFCRRNQNWVGRGQPDGKQPVEIDLSDLVASNTVSRRHALIYRNESNQWFIRDEESANGTLLNGRLLAAKESERLYYGDQVQFGRPGPVLVFYSSMSNR
jgi:hypothetical protein